MSGGGGAKPVPGKTKQTESATQQSQTAQDTSGTISSTVTPTMPDWIAEYLKSNIGSAGANVDAFGNAIGNWQAAGFTPDQLAGFQSMRDAVGGESFQTPMDQLLATSRGDYLYGGPGFNAAVDAAYRAGLPSVSSQFGMAGRDENFLGKASLGQIFSDAFARQYGDERSRQLAASQALPGLSLLPGQTLQDIGAQQQALEQYGTNFPLTLYPQLAALQGQYSNLAAPFIGSSNNQTSTGTGRISTSGTGTSLTKGIEYPSYFPGSTTGGIAGGALAGLSAGAMTGNPYLAAGGAVLGGIGGSGLLG